MPEFITPLFAMIMWAIAGYILGSIPFGMILARIMGLGNLRDIGSGNIGATNVLRTGNKTAAALTLLFDAGKGAVIVLLARAYAGEDAAQLAGLAAIIGHCFPIWLRFKGGKGVATYFGLMIAYCGSCGWCCLDHRRSGWAVFIIGSAYVCRLGPVDCSLFYGWGNIWACCDFGRLDLRPSWRKH